jgi:DHA1 family bicyclomycin/chloramphenicol resistance-like MFS transporter
MILATPTFLTSALCYTLAFSGLIAYFQVSSILLIKGLSLTPSLYGWCALIIASNYLIAGLIVNTFAHRLGTQGMLRLGSCLLVTGGIVMLTLNTLHELSVATVLIPTAIYVIGARIVIPNAVATSMEKLRHLNGSTSALIGFIQMMGSALISLSISGFDNTSILPLAVFLTGCGLRQH